MISHWDEVRTWRGERDHIAGTWSSLTGRSSHAVGLKRIQVDQRMRSTPLHLEGSEEEIFVVLEATATCCCTTRTASRSTPCGRARLSCAAREPASRTRSAQADGMTLLMYGTRELGDVCFSPRSRKLFYSGLGLVARVGEQPDFWEGED